MLEIEERNKDVEEILEGALEIIICDNNLSTKEKFETYQELIRELKTNKYGVDILKDIPDILLEAIDELGMDLEDKEYLMTSLLKELEFNKDEYIEYLEEKLNTYCCKEDICNCCGVELIHNYHDECVGEYQGFPAYEEFIEEGYCPYGCMTL